ncbi:unnamed protein product, partial [Discosporangium mesarthrocarpum]
MLEERLHKDWRMRVSQAVGRMQLEEDQQARVLEEARKASGASIRGNERGVSTGDAPVSTSLPEEVGVNKALGEESGGGSGVSVADVRDEGGAQQRAHVELGTGLGLGLGLGWERSQDDGEE